MVKLSPCISRIDKPNTDTRLAQCFIPKLVLFVRHKNYVVQGYIIYRAMEHNSLEPLAICTKTWIKIHGFLAIHNYTTLGASCIRFIQGATYGDAMN